jgi:phospholipid transport system transporter-binding protein
VDAAPQALPALPAALTQANAESYLAQCRAALARLPAGTELTLVASGLQQFDSAALAVLLALRRELLQRGLRWRIQGLPEHLRELAELYGVVELLPA